ncbi:unnamed protein product [Anisakis simplex]|uniref:protein xylosyltransferase n=1 Tax=Anisakis simplex TaxID=6269 RepID=A0A3P6Q236_ANISI|nr:unnamed protein product [Anisakis simplex]
MLSLQELEYHLARSVFPDSIRFDGGSDWLVLSRDFAQFALTNDALVRSLREMFANILLPVESFFHTVRQYGASASPYFSMANVLSKMTI